MPSDHAPIVDIIFVLMYNVSICSLYNKHILAVNIYKHARALIFDLIYHN